MHNRLEERQERDGQSCQESSKAQGQRNEANGHEDCAERLILQLLFAATR